MNTNRLSESICKALNDQMTKEAHASQIYLSYASWLNAQGYEGVANFLFRHANEERNHMMKFLEYILKAGLITSHYKADTLIMFSCCFIHFTKGKTIIFCQKYSRN